MLLQADSRRRITMPPNSGIHPGDRLELEVMPDGRMLLVPVETIPKHQLWAWAPEARDAVEKSVADSRPSVIVETAEDADAAAGRWERED